MRACPANEQASAPSSIAQDPPATTRAPSVPPRRDQQRANPGDHRHEGDHAQAPDFTIARLAQQFEIQRAFGTLALHRHPLKFEAPAVRAEGEPIRGNVGAKGAAAREVGDTQDGVDDLEPGQSHGSILRPKPPIAEGFLSRRQARGGTAG